MSSNLAPGSVVGDCLRFRARDLGGKATTTMALREGEVVEINPSTFKNDGVLAELIDDDVSDAAAAVEEEFDLE